jgi:hypothetical protein
MNSPQKKNELFEIRGDAQRGVTSGVNFTGVAAKPVVLYRDKLLTLDVYALPGQPMYVILYCPLCEVNRPPDAPQNQSLRISEDNKKIDFDPMATPKIPGFTSQELAQYLGREEVRGRISIEPFRCTWEEKSDLRRGFGLGVCTWNVVIENNIARDV